MKKISHIGKYIRTVLEFKELHSSFRVILLAELRSKKEKLELLHNIKSFKLSRL